MNRNSSFFWLTDSFENVDQDEEELLQEEDTGLSIDDDHIAEGTTSNNSALQFQRPENALPPRPKFLPTPPPPLLGDEEEARPLLVGTKNYGSREERPLFALSENSPVDKTPPILHRRMLATSSNNSINKNAATLQCQKIQPLRFQVV